MVRWDQNILNINILAIDTPTIYIFGGKIELNWIQVAYVKQLLCSAAFDGSL